MSRRKIRAGSTSQTVPIFVQDTSSTTGGGLGGLVFNTSNLAAKYRREGQSTWTTISLVTATVGTWASGGLVGDGGPVTGTYELSIPDAVLAAGAKWAEVAVYGASNMLPVLIEFELDTIDYQASGGKVPATIAAGDIANGAITAVAIASNALNGKGDWSTYAGGDTAGTTTLLTRVPAAVALAGTAPSWYASPLSATGTRSALGLASANLDAQLLGIDTDVLTRATVGSAMTLTGAYDFAKGTVAVAESYAADGAAPTPVQALLFIQQALTEFAISGTIWTIKKLDGSTTAAVLTLDSGATPTSVTRSS